MEILDRIEESGLDKLIKLLTEHCRKHYGFKDNDDIEIDTDSVNFYLYHKGERYFPIGVEKVICKDFGFIKWLVDNDKIDFNKVKKVCSRANENSTATYPVLHMYGFYERLLMLLSIQDNPIEFLISILK